MNAYFLVNLTNLSDPQFSPFFYQTSQYNYQLLRDIQWSFLLPTEAVYHCLYCYHSPKDAKLTLSKVVEDYHEQRFTQENGYEMIADLTINPTEWANIRWDDGNPDHRRGDITFKMSSETYNVTIKYIVVSDTNRNLTVVSLPYVTFTP